MRNPVRPQQGVQSVEIGLRLASSLAQLRRPMSLGELAKINSLPASKTHRYLVSLVRAGLVEQDVRDQRYRLGGGAVYMGLAAQSMIDEYQLLGDAINELHDETGYAITVVIWGQNGPMVIRSLEPPDQEIMIVVRLGATLTVTNTSSGRIFAAFHRPELVDPIVERELSVRLASAKTGKPMTKREFTKIVENVRKSRISSVSGDYRAGYSTLGIPVFRAENELLCAISLIAPSGTLDLDLDGLPARALRDCAAKLEASLGQRPPN